MGIESTSEVWESTKLFVGRSAAFMRPRRRRGSSEKARPRWQFRCIAAPRNQFCDVKAGHRRLGFLFFDRVSDQDRSPPRHTYQKPLAHCARSKAECWAPGSKCCSALATADSDHGRGILLMRAYMDTVRYSRARSEVYLRKRA